MVQLALVGSLVLELSENGIGLVGEFRNTGKDVFKGIAIDEHRSAMRRGTRRIPLNSYPRAAIGSVHIFPLFRNSN